MGHLEIPQNKIGGREGRDQILSEVCRRNAMQQHQKQQQQKSRHVRAIWDEGSAEVLAGCPGQRTCPLCTSVATDSTFPRTTDDGTRKAEAKVQDLRHGPRNALHSQRQTDCRVPCHGYMDVIYRPTQPQPQTQTHSQSAEQLAGNAHVCVSARGVRSFASGDFRQFPEWEIRFEGPRSFSAKTVGTEFPSISRREDFPFCCHAKSGMADGNESRQDREMWDLGSPNPKVPRHFSGSHNANVLDLMKA
uniref:HDC16881 n=1 Tax=Drosophila melanogaster TaxID=7227 RepID=Q6IIV4_DROME|nr:TPA_inf: HDC16881 [Drosophila melanogaster]